VIGKEEEGTWLISITGSVELFVVVCICISLISSFVIDDVLKYNHLFFFPTS
jgi:hypothetical protein